MSARAQVRVWEADYDTDGHSFVSQVKVTRGALPAWSIIDGQVASGNGGGIRFSQAPNGIWFGANKIDYGGFEANLGFHVAFGAPQRVNFDGSGAFIEAELGGGAGSIDINSVSPGFVQLVSPGGGVLIGQVKNAGSFLPTNAAAGMLGLQAMSGQPVGVPAAPAGDYTFVPDDANKILWVYTGAGWQPWGRYTGGHGTACIQTDNSGTWSYVSCGSGSAITALTHDVLATGPGSVPAEVVGITDGTSVDHQVGAGAWANGQAVVLNGSGFMVTASYQTPLTACTDYVSLSCVGAGSDLGGTNSVPTVVGLKESGGANLPIGSVPANTCLERNGSSQIVGVACSAGGTVTSVAGSGGLTCSPSSPNPTCTLSNLTCGANTWVSSASTSGGLSCTQPAFSSLSGSLICTQSPAWAGDLFSAGGTCSVNVVGVEAGASVKGSYTATEVFSPGAPAASKLNCWADTTNDNWECESNAAVVSVMPATKVCAGSTWMHTLNAAGALICTQPAFSDLNGSAACSQLPALTGDITTPGGSCATTNPTKGKAWVDGADAANNAPDYLANKLSSSSSIAIVPTGSNDQRLQFTAVSSPWRMIFTVGGPDFAVDLPQNGSSPHPDFWLRPMAYPLSTTVPGFEAFQQVWEYDAGDSFTSVDLNVFAYFCAITVAAGPADTMVFEVTKNGARTGINVTATCPLAGTSNANYRTTGNSLTVAATDRIGVEAYDTSGSYSSGALRATVNVILRP